MPAVHYASYRSEDLIYNHSYYNSAPVIAPHVHDISELLLLKKGEASYVVDGKTYHLTPKSLVISRPLKVHSIVIFPDCEYERYNILFDENKFASDIYSRIPEHVDVINFEGNTVVSSLVKKMDFYCENLTGDELKTALLHLTEEVFFNVLIASRDLKENNMYSVNPLINQALKYIDRYITTTIRVEDICAELYITKSHLHHLFIKHLKLSPKKYIMSQKLIMARRELRSGSKPTDVALSCGFVDYSTFYRGYKQFFGYAPAEEINRKMVREIES